MLTYRILRLSVVMILFLAVLASLQQSQIPTAFASDGDFVHLTNFSEPCESGLGVGIAFDGEYAWYSCYGSSPDLYKAEALTGSVVASYDVAGGLGALAWDGTREMIWAGWGGGAGADGDVRLIDPTDASATVVFNAAAAVVVGLDDGLAYDAQDDTLYISDDFSTIIYHYSTSGTLLGSFPWAGSDCYNSGLAIGGELLFQGSNGCNHVWVVERSDQSAVFDFDTGAEGVRDEDLECDSVTFSPLTVMWSVEAYDENWFGETLPRRAIAFEIPPGTCATGGGADSDGDGLLDEWETDGITIDPDGDGGVDPQFIDLKEMGADPDKPDIFLHIDWMKKFLGHSHKLDSAAIEKVVDAFANSPYISPTDSVGINLHVDQGPDSVLDFTTNTTWGTLSRARALAHVNNLGTSNVDDNYEWPDFQAIKDEAGGFTETGRTPIFHYIISAHNYDATNSSGISRGFGASDLIVSLGSFNGGNPTLNQQAGTLMHELGHNLGLRHGGNENANYKPNYLSVMNYSFQEGVIKGGVANTFDYSRSALDDLDETHLNEPAGLGAAAAGYGTRHYCAGTGFVPVTNADKDINWNCDGDETDTDILYDVNGDVCIIAGDNQVVDTTPVEDDALGKREIYVGPNRICNTTATGDDIQAMFVGSQESHALTGFDDWINLQLKGGAIGLAGIDPDLPMETEEDLFTVEVAEQILPLPTLLYLPLVIHTSP